VLKQLLDDRVVAVFLSGALLALIELGHDLEEIRHAMRYCLAVQIAIQEDSAKDEFVREVEKPTLRDPRLVPALMAMLAAIQSMGGLGALLAVYRYCEDSELWEQVRAHADKKVA